MPALFVLPPAGSSVGGGGGRVATQLPIQVLVPQQRSPKYHKERATHWEEDRSRAGGQAPGDLGRPQVEVTPSLHSDGSQDRAEDPTCLLRAGHRDTDIPKSPGDDTAFSSLPSVHLSYHFPPTQQANTQTLKGKTKFTRAHTLSVLIYRQLRRGEMV